MAFAQPRITTLQVEQLPEIGGDSKYVLTVYQSSPVFYDVPFDGATLVAPDGTSFNSPVGEFKRDTFAEITTLLFGDWTVTEHPNNAPLRSYSFRVEPFTLDDVFSETPVIDTPANGATVPLDFLVKWHFPSGAVPSSRGSHLRPQNLEIIDIENSVDGPLSKLYKTKLLGPGPGYVTMTATTQTNFSSPDLDPPTIISRDPVLNGQQIYATLQFESHSLPLSLTVVPEPGAISAVATAALVLLTQFRMRWRS
jgi:hypothetical protein